MGWNFQWGKIWSDNFLQSFHLFFDPHHNPSCLETVVFISKPFQQISTCIAVLGGWQLRWFAAGQPLCLCGLWGDCRIPWRYRRSTQDLHTEERSDCALRTEADSANAHPAGESGKLGALCGSLISLATERERIRLYQAYVWYLVQFQGAYVCIYIYMYRLSSYVCVCVQFQGAHVCVYICYMVV